LEKVIPVDVMSKKGIKRTNTNKASKTVRDTKSVSGFKTIFGLVTVIKENRRYQLLLTGFLIAMLVLITYRGAFNNEFVEWDDFAYVVDNDLVRNPGDTFLKDLFSKPVSSNYHPLTILSLRINNNVCDSCPNGISPEPFIRGNVIFHLLNTLLVFLLVYLLSKKNILVAFLVAALFGVHPMHVESVAWVSERKDVLYSFFFLSGLITYLKYLNGSKNNSRKHAWLAATLLLFILSCLSKATAVVFPVVMMLLNFWTYHKDEENPVRGAFKNVFSPKNLLMLLPFFAVSLFIGLMTYRLQNGENFLGILDLSRNQPDMVNIVGPYSVLQKVQVACYGFILYLMKFLVPVNLSALYPYPALQEFNQGNFATMLLMTMAATILIAFLVIRSLRKTKLYAFGVGFYFVTIALVLQFISVGVAMMAERYSYLPYVGLSIIPAMLIAKSTKSKKLVLLIISGCFIILLIVLSKRQIEVWSNTETLWTQVINRHPHEELPRRARGKYYSKMSLAAKNDAEMKLFEDKALIDFTEAIKAGTKSADVFQGTGVIYASKGDLKNAILFLNKAISIEPKKGAAYYNRALVYDRLNQKEEAIKDYNMALIYNPEWTLEILNNRSNLFLETGRFREALQDFDYLIFLKKDNFLYYSNRAFARLQLNDVTGAISDYQKALELKPDDPLSKLNLQKLLQVGK
jgi:Flp pilus assembly protein TadD